MISLTKEQKEKIKKRDWRIDNLYKILNKEGKLVRYVRNDAQRHFDENAHTRNIVLKSRQLGLTTHETIDTFDEMLFRKNYKAVFIAHTKDQANMIFDDKLRNAWANFPLAPLYHKINDKSGVLKVAFQPVDDPANDTSSISVQLSGRSGTYQRAHVTELAKMQKIQPERAKEILTGTIPAVPASGRFDIESTAEGDYGIFYNLYMEALENQQIYGNDLPKMVFKPHFYNWRWDKEDIERVTKQDGITPISKMMNRDFFERRLIEHDLSEKELSYYYNKWLSLNRDENVLLQEFPSTITEAFVSSGNKFFDQRALSLQRPRDPIIVGKWRYYAKRDTSHIYVMGVDPSGGVGEDYAAIVVIDLTVGEVVAEFWDKWTKPEDLAVEAVEKAKLFNNCVLAIEENNHGHAVIVVAKSLNYMNFYYRLEQGELDNKEQQRIGFLANRRTKPLIMNALNAAISEFSLRIPSEFMVRELKSYPREMVDKLRRDESDGHFDRVSACAIAWEARKFAPASISVVVQKY